MMCMQKKKKKIQKPLNVLYFSTQQMFCILVVHYSCSYYIDFNLCFKHFMQKKLPDDKVQTTALSPVQSFLSDASVRQHDPYSEDCVDIQCIHTVHQPDEQALKNELRLY